MTKEQFTEARGNLGLTSYQLAKEWGVSTSTVRKWELGVRPIPALAEYALKLMLEKKQ
jgi:DNA-binding transcriptional regulator YiaG